uniref:helix-turn-helix domain-containing protein n=1 Tax=Xanthomonas albilineans TaxID=29447 RepID=UPI003D301C4D
MSTKKPTVPSPRQIRAARDAAGLTQTQATELICSDLRSWQRWESGQSRMPPGLWELFRLKTCGVPLPEI